MFRFALKGKLWREGRESKAVMLRFNEFVPSIKAWIGPRLMSVGLRLVYPQMGKCHADEIAQETIIIAFGPYITGELD